jgi:hypothetical protein
MIRIAAWRLVDVACAEMKPRAHLDIDMHTVPTDRSATA